MSDETTPDLTSLLARHVLWGYGRCGCGVEFHRHGKYSADHRAHLAEQITAAGFGPVRAVQAERDEWGRIAEERLQAQIAAIARAESAEAALAGLREGIEALRLDLNADANYRVAKGSIGHRLHRLLVPTPDREGESR